MNFNLNPVVEGQIPTPFSILREDCAFTWGPLPLTKAFPAWQDTKPGYSIIAKP